MSGFMPPEASDHARFLTHWRRLPSHEYLDRAAGLLTRLGVGADDPRLCAGTPKGASWVLPVTLNQRYVLAARPSKGAVGFGLILRDGDGRAEYAGGLSESFAFRPFRGEAEPPDWRRFEDLALLDDPGLAASWEAGAAYELARRSRSSFRKHHNGFFGELLTSAEARAAWREEAERRDSLVDGYPL